jgi:glycosyltransferase involved in cell wall biosynthesis
VSSVTSATPPKARFTARLGGLFFDDFGPESVWLRSAGWVRLPPLNEPLSLVIHGEYQPHPAASGIETRALSLVCYLNGRKVARVTPSVPGGFILRLAVPATSSGEGQLLSFNLVGVAFTNFLAWLGRITGWDVWQRFRQQNKNRQLRLRQIETATGDLIFDFSKRHTPYAIPFARQHTRLGINLAGYLKAELGIGESARCMVRAADTSGIDTALITLGLPCKNRQNDLTFAARFQATNPHGVNIVHLDPPASFDLDHHHPGFRTGKYNIAYWAWELPDFPDAWVRACAYFDEIWCPSEFVREAIAQKVPLPVFTMPHAIAFETPAKADRGRFGLPANKFLFLVLYDLNSYSARKNPQAAIEAFRRSGLADQDAALVIKLHSVRGNEADLARLQADVADLPGTVLITETLSRAEVYQLESACDCYVSLHRSEGFGLAVAECMHLGKPVIVTDWSATAEFVDTHNGCPVRYELKLLERNIGPYGKGQLWAEADPDHAADWMRRLHADRELAARLGVSARATIASRFAPAVIGARYRRRLESIASW